MKILYVTQFFSPTRGGGEVVFYHLARELAKKGHEIFVIKHRMSCPEKIETQANINIIEIEPTVRHEGGLPPSLRDNAQYLFNATRVGRRLIKENRIDIVHANNFTPVLPGYLVASFRKLPLIVTIHDVFSHEGTEYWRLWARQSNVSLLSSIIGPLFEKTTLCVPATLVHTVSERTRQDLIEFGVKRNIVVIPNGVDMAVYPNNVRRTGSHQIIFVGRLVFYKNLEVILKAFQRVVDNICDATLVIVGDGPMRLPWENFSIRLGLRDHMKFTGYLSHERKVELLSRSCALVFPSLFEGFGLTILEAFACGIPVIASNISPLTEIVKDEYDGYLLDPRNPDEWSERILDLMHDQDKAARMGMNGKRIVEEQFTVQIVANRIERLYEKVRK